MRFIPAALAAVFVVAVAAPGARAGECVDPGLASTARRTADEKATRSYEQALAKKKLEPGIGISLLEWDKRPAALARARFNQQTTWTDDATGKARRVVLLASVEVACGKDPGDHAASIIELATDRTGDKFYRVRRVPKRTERPLLVCGCPTDPDPDPCTDASRSVTIALELREGQTWGGVVKIAYSAPAVVLEYDDACPATP